MYTPDLRSISEDSSSSSDGGASDDDDEEKEEDEEEDGVVPVYRGRSSFAVSGRAAAQSQQDILQDCIVCTEDEVQRYIM